MGYISNVMEGVQSAYRSVKSRGMELAIAASIPVLFACSSVPDVPTQESFGKFRDTVIRMKYRSGVGWPGNTQTVDDGLATNEYLLDGKRLVQFCNYKNGDWTMSEYRIDMDNDNVNDGTVVLLRDYFGKGKHLIGVPVSEEFRNGQDEQKTPDDR
ncbi:MAG: hypothetical protein HY512_02835 [Candidatus Aenigmarchaeota archaeon]|nr:hypothetical protein [Candidatus Aenigmarchaeota archaeon]